MRRSLTRAMMAGVLVLSGLVGFAAPASAAPPAASVSLDSIGVIGRFASAVISGGYQCPQGGVEQELAITIYQGAERGRIALSSIVCDGQQHRFTTSLLTNRLGSFQPRAAWVEATLTLEDPLRRDLVPPGDDSTAVWLRPNVQIDPVWPLVLNRNGTMTVTVDAVCRGPWATDRVGVMLAQGSDSQVDGATYLSTPDVPCDGDLHRLRLVVRPAPGVQFDASRTTVWLGMSIWDEPDTGDPINRDTWQGQVRLVRR